jgi:hypothetical protein
VVTLISQQAKSFLYQKKINASIFFLFCEKKFSITFLASLQQKNIPYIQAHKKHI